MTAVHHWRPQVSSFRARQQRALNAEQALKTAHAEIRAQRAASASCSASSATPSATNDTDAVERLTAENAILKQRLRDLSASGRTLEERLQAAWSSNRFLDKRIAGREAQLLNTQIST